MPANRAFIVLGSVILVCGILPAQDVALPRVRGQVEGYGRPVYGAVVTIRLAPPGSLARLRLPGREIARQVTAADGAFDIPLGARSILIEEEYVLTFGTTRCLIETENLQVRAREEARLNLTYPY